MAECEKLSACPFFNDQLKDMPAMAEIYKKNFCLSDFKNCARYIVSNALGKDKVPSNLFPNQYERAQKLIKAQT